MREERKIPNGENALFDYTPICQSLTWQNVVGHSSAGSIVIYIGNFPPSIGVRISTSCPLW